MFDKFSPFLNSKEKDTKGLTFIEGLGLVFIALKLSNHIDWSWWIVLSPVYAPYIFSFISLIVFMIKFKNR